MKCCINETSPDDFQASVSAISNQITNNITWVSAFSMQEQNFTLQENEKLAPISNFRIDQVDLKQAQQQDGSIAIVLYYKLRNYKPNREERQREHRHCYVNGKITCRLRRNLTPFDKRI